MSILEAQKVLAHEDDIDSLLNMPIKKYQLL